MFLHHFGTIQYRQMFQGQQERRHICLSCHVPGYIILWALGTTVDRSHPNSKDSSLCIPGGKLKGSSLYLNLRVNSVIKIYILFC